MTVEKKTTFFSLSAGSGIISLRKRKNFTFFLNLQVLVRRWEKIKFFFSICRSRYSTIKKKRISFYRYCVHSDWIKKFLFICRYQYADMLVLLFISFGSYSLAFWIYLVDISIPASQYLWNPVFWFWWKKNNNIFLFFFANSRFSTQYQ